MGGGVSSGSGSGVVTAGGVSVMGGNCSGSVSVGTGVAGLVSAGGVVCGALVATAGFLVVDTGAVVVGCTTAGVFVVPDPATSFVVSDGVLFCALAVVFCWVEAALPLVSECSALAVRNVPTTAMDASPKARLAFLRIVNGCIIVRVASGFAI